MQNMLPGVLRFAKDKKMISAWTCASCTTYWILAVMSSITRGSTPGAHNGVDNVDNFLKPKSTLICHKWWAFPISHWVETTSNAIRLSFYLHPSSQMWNRPRYWFPSSLTRFNNWWHLTSAPNQRRVILPCARIDHSTLRDGRCRACLVLGNLSIPTTSRWMYRYSTLSCRRFSAISAQGKKPLCILQNFVKFW